MIDKNFVASLDKGLQVLQSFDRMHSRMTLSEVSERTQMSAASARRALLTLCELNYLEHDGKRFWLSARVLLFGHAYLTSRATPSIAQPFLDALSELTRESSSLAQWLDDDALIVARSTARRSLTVGLHVGSRLPAYCSASGRVLLAALSQTECEARLRRMQLVAWTPRTEITVEGTLRLVDECRAAGYAVCDEEIEMGAMAMAVPVHDRQGRVIAALNVAARSERMSRRKFEASMLPALAQASARMSQMLWTE